jgi:ribose-phosphate pyrophosphokinase
VTEARLELNLFDPTANVVSCVFSTFPDGQPHVTLDTDALTAHAKKNASVEVLTRFKNANDIVQTCLALEAITSTLQQAGLSTEVNLNIGYMLGARMDRRIGYGTPATLHVLASLVNACTQHVHAVRVFDPHSPVTLELIARGVQLAPDLFISEVLPAFETLHREPPVIVVPDKGAALRTIAILERLGWKGDVATCSKKRDSKTGKLSGFALDTGIVADRACLIIDDICDGGGTFSGIANVLRSHAAKSVSLAVTHGIFSKGITIEGIDCVYSTDSYGEIVAEGYQHRHHAEGIQSFHTSGEGPAKMMLWTHMLSRVVRKQARP